MRPATRHTVHDAYALGAQARPDLIGILGHVSDDLQRLLGTSEIVTRIEEWKEGYVETLMRCEFGSSIEAELDIVSIHGTTGEVYLGSRRRQIVAE